MSCPHVTMACARYIKWEKRMLTTKEAIVQALNERGQPMHVKEITRYVLGKTDRLKGKTPEMTVDSILSKDERFKRVAKGTYVLSEWRQYPRLRWITQIAHEVLSRSGRPLALNEITTAVLAERTLKGNARSTIRSVLRRNNCFGELERDVFGLTEWG